MDQITTISDQLPLEEKKHKQHIQQASKTNNENERARSTFTLRFLTNVLLHDVVQSSQIKCKDQREEKCTVKQLEYIVKP